MDGFENHQNGSLNVLLAESSQFNQAKNALQGRILVKTFTVVIKSEAIFSFIFPYFHSNAYIMTVNSTFLPSLQASSAFTLIMRTASAEASSQTRNCFPVSSSAYHWVCKFLSNYHTRIVSRINTRLPLPSSLSTYLDFINSLFPSNQTEAPSLRP